MDQKIPFFRAHKKAIVIVGFLIVSLIGVPLTVIFLQQTQIFQQQAWKTSQSASAACGPDGKVVITANFSNTEPSGASNAMDVTVRDTVTGGTVNIGTVNPGQTKSGTIQTTRTSITAGGVIFSLTWTNGRSGTDTRTASYPAVAACSQPSPSPTVTPTPTLPQPSPSSSPTPTPTSSPTPSEVPTATPTDVPTGTPTETPTPTVTIALTETPTPTSTPPPGSTETPTPPPGETATPTTVANSPQPTLPPTGPETLFMGLGATALMLIVFGGLLFLFL
jgi:hypothetical protein